MVRTGIDRSRKWGKGKFSNFVEQLFWPQTEVLKYLKSHSRSISIHTTDDQILKQVDFKVIYEMESECFIQTIRMLKPLNVV